MIKNDIRNIPSWSYWDDLCSEEELQKIIEHCQQYELHAGVVNASNEINLVRKSDIKFISPNADNKWFFERMNWVIEQINDRWYGFDLEGYDSFQYTTYDAEKEGHYGTHMDTFLGDVGPMRKLSITFPLNDDYDGGEFYIQEGEEPVFLPQKKGRVLAFPSFVLHGVNPVLSGIRRSIVIWVTGPLFR